MACAESVSWTGDLQVLVARREELLALKVLSATERRPQDTKDAIELLRAGTDRAQVLDRLRTIEARGYNRKQDLTAKFEALEALARVG
jgi:hypothetical protein